jgi:hypothetical protein
MSDCHNRHVVAGSCGGFGAYPTLFGLPNSFAIPVAPSEPKPRTGAAIIFGQARRPGFESCLVNAKASGNYRSWHLRRLQLGKQL